MLKANDIAKIQSALDTLAAIPSARLATSGAATLPLIDLHIKCYYCAAREYTDIGARKITRKVAPAHYYAACEIDGLDVSATGATRAAALRNLFKALHNCAMLNEPTLIVPLALREPTKAKAQARAARAERKAAPTDDIADAIAGLSAEAKIIALTNALVESGVTLHRGDDPGDGYPVVFATLPDGSTATVLNLPLPLRNDKADIITLVR